MGKLYTITAFDSYSQHTFSETTPVIHNVREAIKTVCVSIGGVESFIKRTLENPRIIGIQIKIDTVEGNA